MKLRKKTALVNRYLDFAQRKNLEKITDKKELRELNDEAEQLCIDTTFPNIDREASAQMKTGKPALPPHKLSGMLWNFFVAKIIPSIPHEHNKCVVNYELDQIEVSSSLVTVAGQLRYSEGWGRKKDPSKILLVWIMKLLEGCPADSFHRCNDPECRKWFFNPTKKEKHYCSKACLWRHKSEINRQKDDYKIRQRIRMKFTYVAGSGKTEEGIRKTMIKYMKDLDLSKDEIDKWLNWREQKRASQKKEN